MVVIVVIVILINLSNEWNDLGEGGNNFCDKMVFMLCFGFNFYWFWWFDWGYYD